MAKKKFKTFDPGYKHYDVKDPGFYREDNPDTLRIISAPLQSPILERMLDSLKRYPKPVPFPTPNIPSQSDAVPVPLTPYPSLPTTVKELEEMLKKKEGKKINTIEYYQDGGNVNKKDWKAINWYRNHNANDINKLQQFLAAHEYLDWNAYEDGVMNQATVDAIKKFQKKKGITADGMWGSVTEQKSGGVWDYEQTRKGSYKDTHKYEVGNDYNHTNFTYQTVEQIPAKILQNYLTHYTHNPVEFFSDDPKAERFRQILQNSGDTGAQTIEMIYGGLSDEEKKQVNYKKKTKDITATEVHDDWKKRQDRAAGVMGKVVAGAALAPVAITSIGAGLAAAPLLTTTGLIGSTVGSNIGGKYGQQLGEYIGEKIGDKIGNEKVTVTGADGETYVGYKNNANGSSFSTGFVFDPEHYRSEGRRMGGALGGTSGSTVGAIGGGALATGAYTGVSNTIGKGNAVSGYNTNFTVHDTSVYPGGFGSTYTTNPIDGARLFYKGITTPVKTSTGRLRIGGPTQFVWNKTGGKWNAGTLSKQSTVDDWAGMYSGEAWETPVSSLFGGNINSGTSAKIGNAYGMNFKGNVAQPVLRTSTIDVPSYTFQD